MDEFDRAQELEQRQRDQAISRARHRKRETPRMHDGVRVCIDCDDPVEPARIALLPDAARCISCQTDHERRR